MERRKFVALIIAVAFVCVSVFSALLYSGFFDSSFNHGPILITGDQEFTKEKGVTGGSGTEEDPYIVEGWRIGPSEVELGPEAAVILIKDVSCHFVVRDVSITGPNVFGIMLKNASNGTIENSTFVLCYQGIGMYDCRGCLVAENKVSSCNIGMAINDLDATLIKDNRFQREIEGYPVTTPTGIGLRVGSGFTDLTISGNRFEDTSLEFDLFEMPGDGSSSGLNITPDNTVNGKPILFFEDEHHISLHDSPAGQVIIFNCRDVSISQLEITYTTTGILLIGVSDCRIVDCLISNASWMGGICVKKSENVTMESNWLDDAQVYVDTSSHIAFKENDLAFCTMSSGLYAHDSDNLTIEGNWILECGVGLQVDGENITVTGNILQYNGRGISVGSVYNLQVFLNDFVDNNSSVLIGGFLKDMSFCNVTMGKGNYWSDYDGLDEDEDGIGDTPYVIEWIVQDDYPLMTPVNS